MCNNELPSIPKTADQYGREQENHMLDAVRYAIKMLSFVVNDFSYYMPDDAIEDDIPYAEVIETKLKEPQPVNVTLADGYSFELKQ